MWLDGFGARNGWGDIATLAHHPFHTPSCHLFLSLFPLYASQNASTSKIRPNFERLAATPKGEEGSQSQGLLTCFSELITVYCGDVLSLIRADWPSKKHKGMSKPRSLVSDGLLVIKRVLSLYGPFLGESRRPCLLQRLGKLDQTLLHTNLGRRKSETG